MQFGLLGQAAPCAALLGERLQAGESVTGVDLGSGTSGAVINIDFIWTFGLRISNATLNMHSMKYFA